MGEYRPGDGDQGEDTQYDYDDPRRYTARRQGRAPAASSGAPSGGGAVVSRRSRLSSALRDAAHGRGAAQQGSRFSRDSQGNAYEYGQPYQGQYDQYGAGYGDQYPDQYGQYDQASGNGGGGLGGWLQDRRARRAMRPRREHPHRARNVVLLVLAIIVALYMLICVPIDQGIAFSDSEAQGLSSETSMHIPLTPYYVLLLGSDAREGDTVSRTDTMILCRIDPIQAKVTMVSIPRDTMVTIEGHGTQKINAAYAYGGAAGAAAAVKSLLGVSINHVALIHFDGVQTLVDALGGVTVNVPVDINDPNYTGLVMSAGTYTMDGKTALLFSRVRHGFANGDYQRQQDQRILIEAIMKKALSNPLALPTVGKAMGGLLSTTMRCYNIIPLLARLAVGTPTIYSASIPSTTQTIGGVSYVVANTQELATMMQVVESGGDPSTVANGLS
jgi:LCP family protein required for cell wall assembly